MNHLALIEKTQSLIAAGDIVGAEQIAALPLYAELLRPAGFNAAAATVMRVSRSTSPYPSIPASPKSMSAMGHRAPSLRKT